MSNKVALQASIDLVAAALKQNGIEVFVVEDKAQAKAKVSELIPKQSEVMTYTSISLENSGIALMLNESGEYKSVRAKLSEMNRTTDSQQMNMLGAAPQYAVGSVHAVTEKGEVVIASNSGSQLPAYAYAAENVIWVVGAQKIVKDLDSAVKRIYEYVLPLESERAKAAYGAPGSNVSKLLIINKEVKPNRIKMVIVKESLGY